MTSVPAALAPVAPSQNEHVTAPAVLFTIRMWDRMMYWLDEPAFVPPVAVAGFKTLVVSVADKATGPNRKRLLLAVALPSFYWAAL